MSNDLLLDLIITSTSYENITYISFFNAFLAREELGRLLSLFLGDLFEVKDP